MGIKHIRPLVVVLFLASCQTAIIWRIITGIVNTVDAMLIRWTQSHVSHKVLETMPLLANSDSSSAIIGISVIRCFVASTVNMEPCVVFRRLGESVCLASCSSGIDRKTTTTFGFAVFEIDAEDNACVAAFATTIPRNSVVLFAGVGKNRPATEDLASEVLKSRIGRYHQVVHDRSPKTVDGKSHQAVTAV